MGFEAAKQQYAVFGVDVDAALAALSGKAISIHCWQGDDVTGFESAGESLSGGIQATGNYPGKARTPAELMADFEKATSLIGGKKRINLHASYAILLPGEQTDRDALKPEHFAAWVAFARENGYGIDFNPTFFSHSMVRDSLTLSSPNEDVRAFWVQHGIASRRIAAYIAKELNDDVLCNVWIPDGMKDVPADRLGPRLRLKESLDAIFAEKLPGVIDCVESKVFGIGLEAYTVGSSEFYLNYAASRPGVYNLMDNGHYHPTEMVAFADKVPLHVTRPMRWDSDHVVLLDDELKEMAKEIVCANALDRVLIGLDFFDASINRVAAWVVGTRSMQKALLGALLMPHDRFKTLQDENRFTELMVLGEAAKMLPIGEVWNHWCETQGVPLDADFLADIKQYEADVLAKRG